MVCVQTAPKPRVKKSDVRSHKVKLKEIVEDSDDNDDDNPKKKKQSKEAKAA